MHYRILHYIPIITHTKRIIGWQTFFDDNFYYQSMKFEILPIYLFKLMLDIILTQLEHLKKAR